MPEKDKLVPAPPPVAALLPVPGAGLPNYVDPADRRGKEELEASTLIPRVNIVQRTSTTMSDLGASYGELWHSLNDLKLWPIEGLHKRAEWPPELEPYLVDSNSPAAGGQRVLPLFFVPVLAYHDRTLFSENRLACAAERGGLETRQGLTSPVTDGTSCLECPLRLWRRDAEGRADWRDIQDWWRAGTRESDAPPCTENICVLSLLVLPSAEVETAALVFSRTSAKQGRKLAAQMENAAGPAWTYTWGARVMEQANPAGQKYGAYKVRRYGVTAQPLYEMAAQLYESRAAERLEVHADARAADFGDEEGDSDNPFKGDV